MAKLQITYEDGSQQTIVTDPATWKSYDDGAVRYGSFFMGEVYDARKEQDCKDGRCLISMTEIGRLL